MEKIFKNNLLGLQIGIECFTLFSLASILFILFSPTWFSLRIDFEEKQCWRNSGILQLDVYSGDCSKLIPLVETRAPCDNDENSEICKASQNAIWLCGLNIAVHIIVLVILRIFPSFSTTVQNLCLLLVIFGFSLSLSNFYVMAITSGFFSDERITLIHKEGKGIPFTGFASCSFETNFAKISTIFKSSYLRCVLPGSAVLVALLQLFFLLILLGFIYSYSFLSIHHHHHHHSTGGDFLLNKRYSSSSATGTSTIRKMEEEELSFSIFSCFETKFQHLHYLTRRGLFIIFPFTLLMLQGGTLLLYLLEGIPIMSGLIVELKHSKKILLKDDLSIFNFSPITSTGFFWNSNAKMIAIMSFTSLFLVQVVKIGFWFYFMFVPSNFIFRSRILFLCDLTGKFQLANLFTLAFVSLAMAFHKQFDFGVIEIQMKTAILPGIGTQMYVITFVLNVIVGQLLVTASVFACQWYDKMREEETSIQPALQRTVSLSLLQQQQPPPPTLQPPSSEEVETVSINRGESNESFSSCITSLDLFRAVSREVSDSQRRAVAGGGLVPFQLQQQPKRLGRMHPYCEVLSDRLLFPEEGKQLKFTLKGKVFMWFLLFVNCSLLFIVQAWNIYYIHVAGVLGEAVLDSPDTTYSFKTMILKLFTTIGWNSNVFEISLLFFVTSCFFPLLRVFGLILLWSLPLTLKLQRRLLVVLELISAWSAVDMFLLSLIVMFFEMKKSTQHLFVDSVPNVAYLLEKYAPDHLGDMYADIFPIHSGFSLLVVAVIIDKIVAYIIFEQCVTSIAERTAENMLVQAIGDQEQQVDDAVIWDATQHLLETKAIVYFGPVERYMSSYFPSILYAGFPRKFWNALTSIGFLQDANDLGAYIERGDREW